MSNTPHELADVFPDDLPLLHELKISNPHFVTLSNRYHEVNGEIHRIEAGIETPADAYVESLKKKRLALVDEVSALVSQAKVS